MQEPAQTSPSFWRPATDVSLVNAFLPKPGGPGMQEPSPSVSPVVHLLLFHLFLFCLCSQPLLFRRQWGADYGSHHCAGLVTPRNGPCFEAGCLFKVIFSNRSAWIPSGGCNFHAVITAEHFFQLLPLPASPLESESWDFFLPFLFLPLPPLPPSTDTPLSFLWHPVYTRT